MKLNVHSGILVAGLACGMVTSAPSILAQGQQTPQQPVSRPSSPDMRNPANTNDMGSASGKMDDKKFAEMAAMGGMTKVELGKVAVKNGASDGVKQFGQKMVDDHSKANDQLKEVASKENITLPTSLDAKHQAMVDKLSAMSGPAFDKAYIKDMLKDHKKDVSDFQKESQNGTDPNIKQFASSTLPTLQEHLSLVEGLSKKNK